MTPDDEKSGKAVVTTATPATRSPKPLEEVGEIAGQAVSGIRGVLAEVQGFKTEIEDITRRGLFRLGGAALVGGAATVLVPATAKATTPAPSGLWKKWQGLVLEANKAYWAANTASQHMWFVRQCGVPADRAEAKHGRLQKAYRDLCDQTRQLTEQIFALPENCDDNCILRAQVARVIAEAQRSFLTLDGPHYGRSLATALIGLLYRGELAS